MYFTEFKSKIEELYKKRFPKSFCKCYIFKGLGRMISIEMMLADNKAECISGIAQNDCFNISFNIYMPDDFSDVDIMPEKIVLNGNNTGYKTKPSNRYLYCEHKKVTFRKTTGAPEKIVSTLGKFVDRLHDSFINDYHANNLLDYDMELVKKKDYR